MDSRNLTLDENGDFPWIEPANVIVSAAIERGREPVKSLRRTAAISGQAGGGRQPRPIMWEDLLTTGGFSSSQYLTTMFKEQFVRTPTEAREHGRTTASSAPR